MDRRTFVKTTLAALFATQLPAAFRDSESERLGHQGAFIVRVPEELVEDQDFDHEGFLSAEAQRAMGAKDWTCRRLTELYAETEEIGFLFERAA